jgi:hypothetical protein
MPIAAGNFLGSLVGYGAELGKEKRAARLKLEQSKLDQDYALKLPAAQKAELHNRIGIAMLDPKLPEAERVRLGSVAAALEGRIGAANPERWQVPPSFMEPIKAGGAVPMASNRGAIEMRTVKPIPITEANIQASMAKRRLTRQQAIDAYKAEGHDVSGLK